MVIVVVSLSPLAAVNVSGISTENPTSLPIQLASPTIAKLPSLVILPRWVALPVLELIAMGSLLANSKALAQVQSKIQRYWNAKDLLKDIQAINPDFYPRPIVQKPSQRPGVKMDWLDGSHDYLTKDRFVTPLR